MTNPEKFYQVSKTQLSVARHFGGCKFNGDDYHYNPDDDTLTRFDVWKKEQAKNKKSAKDSAKAEREKWEAVKRDLFDDM